MDEKGMNKNGCIKSVSYDFENGYEFGYSAGDTWCPAWAADGSLYSSSCDGSGFDKKANSNLCMNRITGDIGPDNNFSQLKGETINSMNETSDSGWDYGQWGSKPNWKANGLACIEGVLYLFVSRHGNESYDEDGKQITVQRAWDSSIIKSTDYGMTWTRSENENTENPMFPGNRFGSPFFVQYGQDGKLPENNGDRSNEYIYAISNDGFWNNGNDLILGRVKRSDIASLDPKKWEFYTDEDGSDDSNWTKDLTSVEVKKTLVAPHQLSQASVSYIEPLGRYIMLEWYYNPEDPPLLAYDNIGRGWGGKTYLDTYEAPHPWGPWIKVNQKSVECELGWYNPVIMNKFMTMVDKNTVKTYVACAGDFAPPQIHYKLNIFPLLIEI